MAGLLSGSRHNIYLRRWLPRHPYICRLSPTALSHQQCPPSPATKCMVGPSKRAHRNSPEI
jgi:hypothetical protein